MNEIGLLQSGLVLGLYVALAGAYGFAYTFARILHTVALLRAAFILYALHVLSAVAIVLWTPLDVGWKGLIVASSLAFFVIPPATWRLLQLTHETEVQG